MGTTSLIGSPLRAISSCLSRSTRRHLSPCDVTTVVTWMVVVVVVCSRSVSGQSRSMMEYCREGGHKPIHACHRAYSDRVGPSMEDKAVLCRGYKKLVECVDEVVQRCDKIERQTSSKVEQLLAPHRKSGHQACVQMGITLPRDSAGSADDCDMMQFVSSLVQPCYTNITQRSDVRELREKAKDDRDDIHLQRRAYCDPLREVAVCFLPVLTQRCGKNATRAEQVMARIFDEPSYAEILTETCRTSSKALVHYARRKVADPSYTGSQATLTPSTSVVMVVTLVAILRTLC